MPAEWQARQLLLARSAPGPENMRSLLGSSTLTDFSDNLLSACAQSGAKAAPAMRTIGSSFRTIQSSSGDYDSGLLDGVYRAASRRWCWCSGPSACDLLCPAS